MSDAKDDIHHLHQPGMVMQFYVGTTDDVELKAANGVIEIKTGDEMDIELAYIPARTIHSWSYQPGSVPRGNQPQWFHVFILCSESVEYRYSLMGQKEAFDFLNWFKKAYANALRQ